MTEQELFVRAKFIKADEPFVREYTGREAAPAFRKVFYMSDLPKRSALLHVCALGCGKIWLNSRLATEDLFISPVSDYDKTLWVNEYDVKELLCYGKNVITVQLGNWFFNESFETPWKHSDAPWRDAPKVILELFVDGISAVASGCKFRCKPHTSTIYNQWRSGETYDARLEDGFEKKDYDASDWGFAREDERAPRGVFRLVQCEPIRECEVLPVVETLRNQNGWVLDFGKNSSGYVRMKVREPEGCEIILRHAEEIDSENELKLNGLNCLYPQVPFQTDKVICNGREFTFQPKFVYHGFRFVEIVGLRGKPDPADFQAVFVHQAIRRRTEFSCSDDLINWIFEAGIRAVYSNLFYSLTDCPTREKYGWMNDAQASAEQLCLNFDMKKFFRKWMVDITDSMKEDGDLSAVVPTAGYGYGHGPVADGALFEIPYRIYQVYGDETAMRQAIPYWERAFAFLDGKCSRGEEIVLGDWDGLKSLSTPKNLLAELYLHKFARLLSLASRLDGNAEKNAYYSLKQEEIENYIVSVFFDENGLCSVNTQTGLSFLIAEGFLARRPSLKEQLLQLMKETDWCIDCGMVGMQYLFSALSEIGRPDIAFRVAVSKGEKSFYNWREQGATTLWETWQNKYTDSKNHHMFSGIMGWFITVIAGIRPDCGRKVDIRPAFIGQLKFCHATMDFPAGQISVSWERCAGEIKCTINNARRMETYFCGKRCKSGVNYFRVETDAYGNAIKVY